MKLFYPKNIILTFIAAKIQCVANKKITIAGRDFHIIYICPCK